MNKTYDEGLGAIKQISESVPPVSEPAPQTADSVATSTETK